MQGAEGHVDSSPWPSLGQLSVSSTLLFTLPNDVTSCLMLVLVPPGTNVWWSVVVCGGARGTGCCNCFRCVAI